MGSTSTTETRVAKNNTRGVALCLAALGLVVLLALIVTAFVVGPSTLLDNTAGRAIWPYRYSDRGDNVVFITRTFDLVLLEESFSDGDGFRIGGSVLLTSNPIPGLSGGTDLAETKGNRVELKISSKRPIAIIGGKTLRIGSEEIPLDSQHRKLIVVAADGSIEASEAPDSEHDWESFEYIHEVSERYAPEP